MDITKEQLEELYITENKSIKEVRTILNISKKKFSKLCRIYQIVKPKELIVKKTKETFINNYGVDNPNKKEEIKNKIKRTCLEKYGVDNYAKTDECKDKQRKTCMKLYKVVAPMKLKFVKDKSKETCLKKYGFINPMQSEIVKAKLRNTFYARYGVDHYSKSKEYKYLCSNKIIQSRTYQTKKENGTLLSHNSKQEEQAYQMLLTKFLKEDIERQYKSELYPFSCDFYIKSLDLYIEFQGSWCHGRQPYDPDNGIHQKLLEKWKEKDTDYFRHAIKTWTINDPLKRETAKKNNLNWEEFFNLEELKEYLQNLS